jgi:hypothetical protein
MFYEACSVVFNDVTNCVIKTIFALAACAGLDGSRRQESGRLEIFWN